jgi:trehalose synthase
MIEKAIAPLDPTSFDAVLDPRRAAQFADRIARSRQSLAGRTYWHINATARGGGVAEILQSVLGYLVGAAITTRWLVVDGNDEFFEMTNRVHALLHGEPAGDRIDQTFGDQERRLYDATLADETAALLELVRPGDPVVLHDPQTFGLAPALAAAGAEVVWTCHIGSDEANEHTRAAWDFLRPYTEATRAQVFSRPQYLWEGLDRDLVRIIPPCLDAFSPKNQPLGNRTVDGILAVVGVLPTDGAAPAEFHRQDGSRAGVVNSAGIVEDTPLPPDAPAVCQVSRWDPLKDHAGVMRAFTAHVPPELGAHLLLAGPDPAAISDDPEGQSTFDQLEDAWRQLPPQHRRRVHLACLPMTDPEENAAIVNAIQRRSDVMVQKSLAEGFGLTVAEAMWKGRPVIGSRVGGIQDQIEPGRSGLLVEPTDDSALADAVVRLLQDRDAAAAFGAAAQERVREEYLAPRFLSRYLVLVDEVSAQ